MSHLLDTGLAIAAGALLATAGWAAVRHGLLVEPVDMQVLGPCGAGCTEVRCVMKNQGPIRAVGRVVIDVWSDEGYEDGTWRQEAAYDLAAGASVELIEVFEGVLHRRGKTIVRCMPWYAAGRHRPAP